MLQKVMTKVSGNPGGAVFKDGSKFPNTVIVSPMVLIHHFAFNYEALIKKVTAVLEESDTVAVDMTSDCCCVFFDTNRCLANHETTERAWATEQYLFANR